MQKRLFVLLSFVLLSFLARAQADFRPGYVVLPAGDTLRGQVDYRGAQRSARLCRFQAAPAPVVDYLPEQIRGYGFPASKFYEADSVLLVNDKKQAVFLEVLVKGKASLYFLRDEGKDRFFLKAGATPLQELTERIEKVYQDGRVYTQRQPLYRKVLSGAFQACPAQQASLNSVDLTSGDLVKAVQRYNTCVGGSQQVSAMAVPSSHSRLSLGLTAGVQAANFVISGPSRFKDGRYPYALFPVGGLYLHYTIPNVNERLSLLLDVLYDHQKFEDTYINEYRPIYYKYEQQVRFNLASVRFPLQVRYTFPRHRLRPFVQVGFSNAYAVRVQSEFRVRALATDPYGSWQQALAPNDVRRHEQSLVAGLGLATAQLQGRNLAVEIRAERGNGFNTVPAVSMNVNRYYFLLRYDLTKH